MNMSRLKIRRLLVASLPPSPFTSIACPAMEAFLAAFYVLHGIYVLSFRSFFAFHAELCPDVAVYTREVLRYGAILLALHFSIILPNALRAWTAKRTRWSTEEEEDGLKDISPRAANKRASHRFTLAVVFLLLGLQQVGWCFTLLDHLRLNWNAYQLINAETDRYRATNLDNSIDPNSRDVHQCGWLSSVQLLRWSLVCITVTTALVLSLLILWIQETVASCRKFAQTRGKRDRENDSPMASASAYLDLQTEEVHDEEAGLL